MRSSARHAGECIFCAFHARVAAAPRRPQAIARATVAAPATLATLATSQTTTPIHASTSRGFGTSSVRCRYRSKEEKIRAQTREPSRLTPPRGKVGQGTYRPLLEHQRKNNWKDRWPTNAAFKLKFADALKARLKVIKEELRTAPIVQTLDDIAPLEAFNREWRGFVESLLEPDRVAPSNGTARAGRSDKTKEMRILNETYEERGTNGLDDRIKYAFYDHLTTSRFTPSDILNQKALADLRYPTEWFPATRSMHRTIHLHVGPTNSGKTYHALQRLEQAESGVYAGPLRLLAHEVFTRLNAKGKRCTLVTGEERRSPDDEMSSAMQSCTVEMMPLNKLVDVAVIDEIQMIGNEERGWAWTQALLGVRAKEVHLCGEARTVPLIRELCASVGEKLEVHEYKRLSPLQMAKESLNGDLKKLRKGDCIVSFSVMGIHALRKQIEQGTGRKVATVYGSLPPETRAQQARLFNDPDNDYDYLVASDAIGMGLNLSIKRVIFESATKWDGFSRRPLAIAETKQIAGRAGRYRSAHQDNADAKATQDLATAKSEHPPMEANTSPSTAPTTDAPQTEAPPATPAAPSDATTMGYVTTLEKFDLPLVAAAMENEPEPILTAGLFPPAPIVERFATYFPPGTPFSYILMRLHELSQMHSRFHLCRLRDQLWIADLIESEQGLTVSDRGILCACPASKTDGTLYKALMPAFARCIARQSGGSLLDIEELPLEVLELEVSASREYLRELERLHKGIVAYLWLSYRFAGIFSTRPLAFHVKSLVEEKIEQVLSQFSFTEMQRKKITAARERTVLEDFQREVMASADDKPSVGHANAEVLDRPQDKEYAADDDNLMQQSDLDVLDALRNAPAEVEVVVEADRR